MEPTRFPEDPTINSVRIVPPSEDKLRRTGRLSVCDAGTPCGCDTAMLRRRVLPTGPGGSHHSVGDYIALQCGSQALPETHPIHPGRERRAATYLQFMASDCPCRNTPNAPAPAGHIDKFDGGWVSCREGESDRKRASRRVRSRRLHLQDFPLGYMNPYIPAEHVAPLTHQAVDVVSAGFDRVVLEYQEPGVIGLDVCPIQPFTGRSPTPDDRPGIRVIAVPAQPYPPWVGSRIDKCVSYCGYGAVMEKACRIDIVIACPPITPGHDPAVRAGRC
jgi:hypothetical protein